MSEIKRPKNIILIVLDTLRADHLGCYRYDRIISPNIDLFSKDSIIFNRTFSACSYTIPSHGTIFTGKNPCNHVFGFSNSIPSLYDPDREIMIHEILSSLGYKTAGFISGLPLMRETGFANGFEIYNDGFTKGTSGRIDDILRRGGEETNEDVFKWLEDNREMDFFLFIHYFDIHGPYVNSKGFMEMFRNDEFYGKPTCLAAMPDIDPVGGIPDYQLLKHKRDSNGTLVFYENDARYYISEYDACIRYADFVIEQLFNRLKALGIYDDSCIIVTSDHGEAMGENNVWFFHGLTVTPDQIHVPLLVKPHKNACLAPKRVDTHSSLADLFPTICDLVGFDWSNLGIDGNSLIRLMRDDKDEFLESRTIISEIESQIARIDKDNIRIEPRDIGTEKRFFPYVSKDLCKKTYIYSTETLSRIDDSVFEMQKPVCSTPEFTMMSYDEKGKAVSHYNIEVSNICNLQCPSCVNGYPLHIKRYKGFIGVDIFRQIIEKIIHENPSAKSVALYNWGEPFLHRNLADIISIVKKNGLSCMLSSNFNFSRNLDEIVQAQPDYLRISLSGFYQHTYSRTHKGGNIELVIQNMHKLRRSLDRHNSTISVEVFYHMYLHNMGDDFLKMKSLCAELRYDFHPVWAYLNDLERLIDNLSGKYDKDIVNLLVIPPKNAAEIAMKHWKGDCPLRAEQMTINIDGSVALCCATYDSDSIAPNFLNTSHEVLQGVKYKQPLCQVCMAHGIPGIFTYAGIDELNEAAAKRFQELGQYLVFSSKDTQYVTVEFMNSNKRGLEFTGERYMPDPDVNSPEISYEHWHRYLFATQFAADKIVLDVACGEGYGSYLLSQYAKKVIGVDISKDVVNHAFSRYVKNNIEFKVGAAGNIPIEGESIFDVIVSFETIEHLSEEEQISFLKEIKRLLKPEGLFIVSTPNKLLYSDIPNYRNEFHIKEFYLGEIRNFLSNYFKNIRLMGQKIYPVSYIWDTDEGANRLAEYRIEYSENGFKPSGSPKDILYAIAICSNEQIQTEIVSILVDISERLFKIKDQYISNLGTIIKDKNVHISNLEAALTDKDTHIKNIETHAKNIETYAKNLEAAVKEKDAHIGNLERLVKVKDQYIINLEKSIVIKDDSIREKDVHINNLEDMVKHKDVHIGNLEDMVKHKDVHIGNLENRIRYLEEAEVTLRNIYSSHGWKLLTYYYRIRERILPPNTWRRDFAKQVFNLLRLLKHRFSRTQKKVSETKFVCAIENDLKGHFVVGKGNAFLFRGWCYHTTQKIRRLYALVDDVPHLIRNFGLVRKDVFRDQYSKTDMLGNSLHSGFWTIIPFEKIGSGCQIDLNIRAVLNNGEICESQVGTIMLEPTVVKEEISNYPVISSGTSEEPLIAICMTTYNPKIELFRRQINSIVHQTYKNWLCIINDDCSDPKIFEEIADITEHDNRFRLFQNQKNLGVYHNFERCLSMVPAEASFVAISDQDDYWHEDKLSVLLSAVDEDTTLVYSDMNIVDESGKTIYNTYWTTRRNNFKELDLLILANTVTGAASLFRRELLDYILPFPEKIWDFYYDHFIACVALAKGNIKYVDNPLYDYYQHSSNIIGHCIPTKEFLDANIPRFSKHLKAGYLKSVMWYYYDFYFVHYIRGAIIGNVLKVRCGEIAHKKKAAIERFAALENSQAGIIFQVIKDKLLHKEEITLGVEYGILRSIIAKKIINVYFRLRKR